MLGNMVKTTLLLGALSALLVLIGGLLGGTGGTIFALVFAVLMNMGAWWFSDTLALRMSGAKEISAAEAPGLHNMVEQLAERAKLPKPRVYTIESQTPNAFATGRSPEKGAVAVTTGIMNILNRDELAGVLSHELAHIKHRDTLISSVAATIAGTITAIANIAQWSLLFGGYNRDDDRNGGNAVTGILLIFLAPVAATLIQLAISRSREYLADEEGARIVGDPLPLASALGKLETAASQIPMRVNPATSHLYIVNPLRGGFSLAALFSTHPSTADRIARLQALEGRIG